MKNKPSQTVKSIAEQLSNSIKEIDAREVSAAEKAAAYRVRALYAIRTLHTLIGHLDDQEQFQSSIKNKMGRNNANA